jgi:hypothetical protein
LAGEGIIFQGPRRLNGKALAGKALTDKALAGQALAGQRLAKGWSSKFRLKKGSFRIKLG